MGNAYQIKDQSGIYFLTFQVVGWADIFTRQIYRDIVIESFEYHRKVKGLMIFAFVIMSNHVHLICKARNSNLSDLVRDVKKRTSRLILKEVWNNYSESRRDWLLMIFRYHAKFNVRSHDQQFWTHENQAIELSDNEMIDQRINYIHENPVRAGWVEKAEEYMYSSAKNLAGMVGVMEIDDI